MYLVFGISKQKTTKNEKNMREQPQHNYTGRKMGRSPMVSFNDYGRGAVPDKKVAARASEL